MAALILSNSLAESFSLREQLTLLLPPLICSERTLISPVELISTVSLTGRIPPLRLISIRHAPFPFGSEGVGAFPSPLKTNPMLSLWRGELARSPSPHR